MTQIFLQGKPVRKIDFHLAGDDGEFLWIYFETEDGRSYSSYYFKGEA